LVGIEYSNKKKELKAYISPLNELMMRIIYIEIDLSCYLCLSSTGSAALVQGLSHAWDSTREEGLFRKLPTIHTTTLKGLTQPTHPRVK